jgi:hypothetical protein
MDTFVQWFVQSSGQRLEFNLSWNLDLFSDTLSSVLTESRGVTNFEGVWRNDSNLELLVIDLGHTFNFSEDNPVSIFETVSLVIIDSDNTLFSLGDRGDDGGQTVLTIVIENGVAWSEIDESPTVKTQTTGPDESDWLFLGSAELIDLDQEISIGAVSEDNDVKSTDEVSGNFTLVVGNLNIWVQFLKLANRGSSSSSASDISISSVEIASEIWSGDSSGVMDSDGFWTGQNQVLGSFKSNLQKVKIEV